MTFMDENKHEIAAYAEGWENFKATYDWFKV